MIKHNYLSLNFKGKGSHRQVFFFIIITITGQQHVSPRIFIITTLSTQRPRYLHLDLQEHRGVEQSALHCHLTISMMAFGGWEHLSSGLFDLTSCARVEAVLQRIRGLLLSNSSLTPYCGLDLDVLFERTRGCRQLFIFSHMLWYASNLDALCWLCNRDECSQHREQVIGDFSGIRKHRQSLDDYSICFEVDLRLDCLAYTSEPLSVVIVCPRKCVKGWQTSCSLCTQSSL